MKIELKNIHFSEKLSEETNAFSANLYINGIKAGTASNRGHGDAIFYRSGEERGKKLIADAENFCSSLPHEKYIYEDREFSTTITLESYIGNLLDKYLEERSRKQFQKKVENAMKKGIVVGIPGKTFGLWSFKAPLEKVLSQQNGDEIVKRALVNSVIPSLVHGQVIMNTNIPLDILKRAGLTEKQHVAIKATNKPILKVKNKDSRRKM